MTTHAYNLKLQAQGRIVVPTDVRTELGVQEGDELILVKEDFGYRMTSRRLLAESLYGVTPAVARKQTLSLQQRALAWPIRLREWP